MYSFRLHSALPWGSSSAVCPPALKRIFRLRSIPPAFPPDVPEEKASPEWQKEWNQHVFSKRKPLFIFLLELQQATPGR
jgi:hypothetical protein